MLILYGSWGSIANLALAINVTLTFPTLNLFGATFALQAGIVLGVGLAVDANSGRCRVSAR
jgi:SecD/SecF fusion protein